MDGNIDDDTYSRPQIQSLIDKNPGHVFMFCATGADSAWQSPVEAGFKVEVSKPKPPAPPPAISAPPPLPKPVAPPALPNMPSTPPPVVAVASAAPSSSALTAEEQAEHDALKAQFDAGSLPSADLMKFVQYVQRMEKA
jgi:hypothetical protein